MNTTHDYTDEQLQAAIDAAFPAGARPEGFNLDNRPSSVDWKLEAPNRLAIARAFLADLPKPAEADPYARLKAYAAAGARIRCGSPKSWRANVFWLWNAPPPTYEVHPDDLHLCPEYAPKPPAEASAEPEQVKPTQEALLEEAMKHPGVADVEKLYGQQAQPAGHGPQAVSKADEPARPQAAEIAKFKAALAESEKQFQDKVYEIARLLDECDKAQGILKACLSVTPFGNIETHTFENLPGRIADLASEIASLSLENERLETELAALRTPILADDGRSLEQVAIQEHEKAPSGIKWFAAANAVATVAITRAVQRIEAVTEKELQNQYWKGQSYVGTSQAIERIRARLIAAAKGEGQAMTKNVPGDKCPACGAEEVESNTPNTTYACGSSDYDGRPDTFHPGDKCEAPPVVVNEPPQDERQPDLSGESEKQAQPAWIPHDGGPCPLRDEEVDLWDFKLRHSGDKQLSAGRPPSEYYLQWEDMQGTHGITAFRVLKWKPGFGPEAKAQPAQTQQEPAQPWTPAVGDVVRLKSGGPKMTVVEVRQCGDVQKSHVVWITEEGRVSGIESLSAACLTPAQP